MARMALIAFACVGGLIAMLFYITGPAQDRIEQQDKIMKDGGKHLAGKPAKGHVHIPKDRPRKADHLPPGLIFKIPEAAPMRPLLIPTKCTAPPMPAESRKGAGSTSTTPAIASEP